MLKFIGVLSLLLASAAYPQRRVDPKNTYVRIICVVPIVGTGTAADAKRPQYAPLPTAGSSQPSSGIIGFMHQASDDGKYALVEYVAKDKSAFAAILKDKKVTVFFKGKDSKKTIEAELKKYKKDFDLSNFGLVMP
jgi:hypothetical protein